MIPSKSVLSSVIVGCWELFELNCNISSKSKIKLYNQTNITEWKRYKINSVRKGNNIHSLLASGKKNSKSNETCHSLLFSAGSLIKKRLYDLIKQVKIRSRVQWEMKNLLWLCQTSLKGLLDGNLIYCL